MPVAPRASHWRCFWKTSARDRADAAVSIGALLRCGAGLAGTRRGRPWGGGHAPRKDGQGWHGQQPSSADGHDGNPRACARMAIGCGHPRKPLTMPPGFASTCVRPGCKRTVLDVCSGTKHALLPLMGRPPRPRKPPSTSYPAPRQEVISEFFCEKYASGPWQGPDNL